MLVGDKYVFEMNMKPDVPWPLVVGGQVQESRVCIQEEGCCTTGLVKCYREGLWPVGTEGSGRLLVVREWASLSGGELGCETVRRRLACSGY